MNRNEILGFLRRMSMIYPNAFKPDADTLYAWEMVIGDYPVELAEMALTEYLATAKYPPKPMDIKDYCERINDSIVNPLWDVFHVVNIACCFASKKVNEYVTKKTAERESYGV